MTRVILLIVIVSVLTLMIRPLSAQAEESATVGLGKHVGVSLVRLYQGFLSPFMIHRCPMCPNCSSYALQALEKHGLLMGWFMAVDRLLHEAGEVERSSSVFFDRGAHCVYDPVVNNDFWWARDSPEITPDEAADLARDLLP